MVQIRSVTQTTQDEREEIVLQLFACMDFPIKRRKYEKCADVQFGYFESFVY